MSQALSLKDKIKQKAEKKRAELEEKVESEVAPKLSLKDLIKQGSEKRRAQQNAKQIVSESLSESDIILQNALIQLDETEIIANNRFVQPDTDPIQ